MKKTLKFTRDILTSSVDIDKVDKFSNSKYNFS